MNDDLIIRQLKRTQERTETHACDLIDRQAAIDELEKAICEDGFRSATGLIHKTIAYDIIRHLPSAQPEQAKSEI